MRCLDGIWTYHFAMFLWIGRHDWAILFAIALIGYVVAREVIPAVIRLQRDASVGQHVYESGPTAHRTKQGTPTMGGIAFPIAAAAGAGFFAWSLYGHRPVLWMVGIVAAVAAIGFADDYLMIRRRTALGLRARTKLLFLLGVAAIALLLFLRHWGSECLADWGSGIPQFWFGQLIIMPWIWFGALALVAIVGSANAVNLTDGVDGLAGSVALPPLLVLSLIGTYNSFGEIGIAVTGALVAFLIFNMHPAKVFMGDTGSLTLGALLAFLAIADHALLFLPLLGIVFVAEALSVIIQVVSFKLTGKRVFKMSPLHHHFELSGWSEQRITRTFALVSWLATAVFCAIVYFSNMRVAGGL